MDTRNTRRSKANRVKIDDRLDLLLKNFGPRNNIRICSQKGCGSPVFLYDPDHLNQGHDALAAGNVDYWAFRSIPAMWVAPTDTPLPSSQSTPDREAIRSYAGNGSNGFDTGVLGFTHNQGGGETSRDVTASLAADLRLTDGTVEITDSEGHPRVKFDVNTGDSGTFSILASRGLKTFVHQPDEKIMQIKDDQGNKIISIVNVNSQENPFPRTLLRFQGVVADRENIPLIRAKTRRFQGGEFALDDKDEDGSKWILEEDSATGDLIVRHTENNDTTVLATQ